MRYLFSSFVFLSLGLLAISASADPGDKEGKKGGDPYAGMREKILKEFDKDGDGKLSDDEREAARGRIRELRMAAAQKPDDKQAEKGPRREGRPGPGGPPEMRERRDDRGERERGRDERGEGRGAEGRRGPGGPGGPPMMPKPEEMFSKFDKNNDDQLSKKEFKALTEFVHEHRPHPRLADRGGPPGPPREGRGSGRRGPEDHVFAQRGPDEGPRMRDGDRPRPPRDGEGPRFRDGEEGGRRFRGPGGPDGPPPPRDGERGERHEFHRHDGPPGDGPGARGGEFRRERIERFEHWRRDEARDRDDDDDDDRPARTRDRDRHRDHDDDKDEKAASAI